MPVGAQAKMCGAFLASGTFGMVSSERFGMKHCTQKAPAARKHQAKRKHKARTAVRKSSLLQQTDNDGRVIFSSVHASAPERVTYERGTSTHSVSTSDLVGPLASKVANIVNSCGAKVVSAVRHTLVAGTRTLSLHASGRAADVQGNPSCIYAMLRDWPGQGGGYTTDYKRVRHVHNSYGGREAGLAFRHGGHSKKYAKRRHCTRA
jgi:hypothetical protein